MNFPPKFSLSYTFQTPAASTRVVVSGRGGSSSFQHFLGSEKLVSFQFQFSYNFFFKFLCPIRIVFNRIELLESNADHGGP